MNISETTQTMQAQPVEPVRGAAQTQEQAQVQAAAVARQTRDREAQGARDRSVRTAARENRNADGDVFVKRTAVASARYDVSDVKERGMRNPAMETDAMPNDRRNAQKILDIVLAPGIKNLKVYRKNE